MSDPNSLIAHLIELRGRVLKAVLSVFVVFETHHHVTPIDHNKGEPAGVVVHVLPISLRLVVPQAGTGRVALTAICVSISRKSREGT